MNERETEIIRYILVQGKTHYEEIAAHMNLSQRTIANVLDQVEPAIKNLGVQLIRRPNDGIYFTGKLDKLRKSLSLTSATDFQSKGGRQRYILFKLLLNSMPYTLQGLADELFVSRSTVENDFLIVRKKLTSLGIGVEISHQGINISANEDQRREAIAELISQYWGQEIYAEYEHGELIRTINLPPKLQQLFSKYIISLVMDTLTEFIEKSHLIFSDYEFQSLAIHLMIALERINNSSIDSEKLVKLGKNTKLLNETKLLVTILERRYQHSIPMVEQRYLNLHIVAAMHKKISLADVKEQPNLQKGDSDFKNVSVFLKKRLVNIHPDKELLEGLSLHLESTIKRLKVGLNIYNPYTKEIRRNLPEAFDAAVELKADLQTKYEIILNDDELAFIALHFESFYERHLSDKRLRVVVVCSSGIGTSQLLAQRLETRFNKILQVNRVTTVADLFNSKLTEDLVISTIPISNIEKPVICVGPLLEPNDIQVIQSEIKQLQKNTQSHNPFFDFLKPELILIKDQSEDYQQTMETITQALINGKYIKNVKEVLKAVDQREELASTAMERFALPHVNPKLIEKSALVLLISKKPILWKKSEVNFIFFIGLNNEVKGKMRDIFKLINAIIDDQQLQGRLLKAQQEQQVIKILKEWNKGGF